LCFESLGGYDSLNGAVTKELAFVYNHEIWGVILKIKRGEKEALTMVTMVAVYEGFFFLERKKLGEFIVVSR